MMTDVAEVCLQSTERKVTSSHMRLEEAGKDPALAPSGGAWPCPHLDFRRRAPELGDTICQPPLSLFQQDFTYQEGPVLQRPSDRKYRHVMWWPGHVQKRGLWAPDTVPLVS